SPASRLTSPERHEPRSRAASKVGSRNMTRMWRGERGQALPLVLMVLAFTVAVALGLARLSRIAAERGAARHAADAAALAGAIAGRPGAVEVARANGADLVSFSRSGDVVEVVVRRSGTSATARAELVARLTGR